MFPVESTYCSIKFLAVGNAPYGNVILSEPNKLSTWGICVKKAYMHSNILVILPDHLDAFNPKNT